MPCGLAPVLFERADQGRGCLALSSIVHKAEHGIAVTVLARRGRRNPSHCFALPRGLVWVEVNAVQEPCRSPTGSALGLVPQAPAWS